MKKKPATRKTGEGGEHRRARGKVAIYATGGDHYAAIFNPFSARPLINRLRPRHWAARIYIIGMCGITPAARQPLTDGGRIPNIEATAPVPPSASMISPAVCPYLSLKVRDVILFV